MKIDMHNIIKIIVMLICLSAILFSLSSAAGAENSELTDIHGTPFFTSIVDLNQSGIIKGYPDSTFRPYRNLSRAEAVTLIYRAYGDSTLALANPYYFKDVAANMWATPYIDYGAGAGIIKGYPDGTFQPDAEITYNEVITLVVRAKKLDTGNLSWPDDYIQIARKEGMLKELNEVSLPSDGNTPANRGNTAILIACGSVYNTTAAEEPVGDLLAEPDMACINYGLMRETAYGTDKLENRCGLGYLLIGDTTYEILTSNQMTGLFSAYDNPAYGLLRVRIENGRAVSVDKVTESWQSDHPRGLLTPASPDTDLTAFCRIISFDGHSLFWQAGSEQSGTLSVPANTVCYEIGLDQKKIAASRISVSGIKENDMIAVYSLTDEPTTDVVIVVHPEDFSDILHTSDNPNVMYMG